MRTIDGGSSAIVKVICSELTVDNNTFRIVLGMIPHLLQRDQYDKTVWYNKLRELAKCSLLRFVAVGDDRIADVFVADPEGTFPLL